MDIHNLFKRADPAPICCGTGLVALDVVYPKMDTDSPELYVGGSCGNVLTILAYLGWRSYPFARLKNDIFSEVLVKDLQRWQVKTDFISKSGSGSTPLIVEKISQNRNDEPFHTFNMTCPRCGSILPRYKPVLTKEINLIMDLLPNPFVFYLDRVSRGNILLAQEFKNKGALIFFEPSSIKSDKMFNECIVLADIVKYSDTTKVRDPTILKGSEIPLIIRTLGSKGIEYSYMGDRLDGMNMHHMDAFSLKHRVDTAGAGDWCSAGVIHALNKYNPQSINHISNTILSEILSFGQALAALNCQYSGARGNMYHMTLNNLAAIVTKLLNGEDYVTPKERITPVYMTNKTEPLCPKCLKSPSNQTFEP